MLLKKKSREITYVLKFQRQALFSAPKTSLDPSLWLDSWFNPQGRTECVVLHLLFFPFFRGPAALVVPMTTRRKLRAYQFS